MAPLLPAARFAMVTPGGGSDGLSFLCIVDLQQMTLAVRFANNHPMQSILTLSTSGQGLYEFTSQVKAFVREAGVEAGSESGLCTLFVRHTSCSLIIQENADPEVQTDLKNFFTRLVPPTSDPSMAYITHTYEGPDDMPAHIKAALTQTSISIPVIDGELALGTWQGIYLFEHRDRPHSRQIVLHLS